MKKMVRAAREDQTYSVDLFDAERMNHWGEPYCVAPAILPSQVEQAWEDYLQLPRS